MPATLATITPSRIAAAETLADVRGGALLDHAFDRRAAQLDARDRRWTQELLWGMLRKRGWIDAILASRATGGLTKLDAEIVDLLRLGVYQLLEMGSVPPYAAIGQTVELAKRRHGLGASKLVNAVLRRVDRERDALITETPTDPIDAETRALLAANNTEAPMIVRPWGVVREQLEAMLEADGVAVADAPLLADSIQLGAGTALRGLAAFREGRCFVQDPAATLVVRYAAIPAGARVADLCAAPGGKAVELARTAGEVIAADSSEARLTRVEETVARLGLETVTPIVLDAREAASLAPCDVVLVDAPCTGTGTFRRHPDARWRLKPSDLAVMAATQRAILRAAAEAVAPGGLLIYSTCSLEPEENDAQVESFLADHPDWTLEPPPAGTVPATVLDAGRLRVLPQRHGTDGSFAARLRRGLA
ncbi:MAG: hypothetical protein LW836_08670 [Gemmatimonadetes bacterium]|nr:hypothetical protein [Gemmatimonadota bacterium]